jgi:beta-lactamase superfamily II metal-dependent hydrolase
MALIRSFAVGNGDMFYIKHNSDNFTIIDCQLFGEYKDWLVAELKRESKSKGITRFISTHPDEDHIQGIEYLDEQMPIQNFYVVKNNATKPEKTESFKHYCQLRDGDKAYYVHKGCKRKWINESDETRGTAGIQILWPNTSNEHFKTALQNAADGTAFNNISLVARYAIEDSASFMWIGDLETQFMEDIFSDIVLQETTVVFAPHHGRKSGKLPNKWLDKLRPKIIVIGEAESRHLHYYTGYNKIIQTKAGDLTFIPDGRKIHCYASNEDFGMCDWLDDQGETDRQFYIGTLNF